MKSKHLSSGTHLAYLLVSPSKELKTNKKPSHEVGHNSPSNQTRGCDLHEMELASYRSSEIRDLSLVEILHTKGNRTQLCQAPHLCPTAPHLQCSSVLTENCSCVTGAGDWITFPDDKQLHLMKTPLHLKLIFAGRLPTDRSGQEVTVRTRTHPGQAGGLLWAQNAGKGERGSTAGVLQYCFSKYTCSVVRQRASALWMLVEQRCLQVQKLLWGLPVRHESQQAGSPSRALHSERWPAAGLCCWNFFVARSYLWWRWEE